MAESIAAHVAGVTKVNNNLTVGNPQAAANAANLPMSGNESDDSTMAPIPATRLPRRDRRPLRRAVSLPESATGPAWPAAVRYGESSNHPDEASGI